MRAEPLPAEEEAAPVCADKIAMEDHLRPPRPAPSEIRYKLPPSVFLDRAPLRSRKHPGGRRVPAWPLQPAKAVRKFQFDHANSARSQNQSDGRQLCH